MRFAELIARLLAVAALAGCASPPSNFYTLTRTATSSGSVSSLSIVVGPVSIPAIVDLPQFVVTTGPNEVRIDEYNRWASPLQNNIARVVADDLVAIVGTPRVTLFQQATNVAADYRVAIEVQGFESILGDAAVLNALWVVRRASDGKAETGRTTVRESVSDKSYGALAAAHSRALTKLSSDIGDAVKAMDRVR